MNELSLCACVLGQGGHCVCSLSEWMGSQLYDISQEHLLSAMGKRSKRRDVFNKQHSTMQTTMILKKQGDLLLLQPLRKTFSGSAGRILF